MEALRPRKICFLILSRAAAMSPCLCGVAEVASNPVSSLWDSKNEWITGGVCDESGVLAVASGTKTCDDQTNVRKLRRSSVALACSHIEGGAIGECNDGSVVAGLVNQVGLSTHGIVIITSSKER